jgi:hypothetical protein
MFAPSTGSEQEWNAAFYRVEDYLRALRVADKVRQSQLVLQILEATAVRHAAEPALNPTALAMEEARARVEQWFEAILGRRGQTVVAGLIALLVLDAPTKWSATLLSEEVPVEFQKAMRESEVRAGPDLRVSSMTPRPIDVRPIIDSLEFAGTLTRARPGLALVAFLALVAVICVVSIWLVF